MSLMYREEVRSKDNYALPYGTRITSGEFENIPFVVRPPPGWTLYHAEKMYIAGEWATLFNPRFDGQFRYFKLVMA